MSVIAIDTETYRIGPGAVAPKVVCLSYQMEAIEGGLYGNGDDIENAVIEFLESKHILVGHNMKFDLACLYFSYPKLQPLIWKALEQNRVTCTQIRERLLNLSSHGFLENIQTDGGAKQRIRYSLADLIRYYTGRDRSFEKNGKETWRLNYCLLDGLKADKYPDDAVDYACDDAMDTMLLYQEQEDRIESKECGPSSVETQYFQTACDFALYLMTCKGMTTNLEAVKELEKKVNSELTYEKLNLIVEEGILRLPEPPRPYKNAPNKFTKAKPEKVNTKVLKKRIEKISEENDIDIRLTPKGEIKADKEVLTDLSNNDPVLRQYLHRQNVVKIRNTEIPRLSAGLIHPNYQVLERSGRTASFEGKKPLYPAFNAQNVDRRVRHCIIPREGFVFCSTDYSSIELVSLAWKCKQLFGYSKLWDIIQDGKDPHAYLGAYLARNLDEEFKGYCSSYKDVYEAFMNFKKSDDPEDKAFFKHWRTFAKPTGLGYPGGLGAKRFTEYAKTQFGVEVNIDQAKAMKNIWLALLPEMREYFQYITRRMIDPKHRENHLVVSPLGMYRANASYCAACNCNALQAPTAEGAKGAVFKLSKACYDPSQESILSGCYPLAFIHDEIITEIPEDDLMHVRVAAIEKIMVDTMKEVLKEAKVKAESALMKYWTKEAEAVYDEQGRLQVWQP